MASKAITNMARKGPWLHSGIKRCATCMQEFPISAFYWNKEYQCPAYKCKTCENKYRLASARLNPEPRRLSSRKWTANHLEESRRRGREQYRKNPSRYAANVRARQVRQEHATPAWAELDKIKIVYRKARELGMHVDHIVPIKHPLVCGLHVWSNLQVLDPHINLSKRNLDWPDSPMEHS